MNENMTLHGIVHGRTIELDRDLGLPEGQQVTVTVQSPVETGQDLAPGEGLRRSAGSWSDDVEGLDQYLEWTRKQRKQVRPELEQ
jgi:hypothetical protein